MTLTIIFGLTIALGIGYIDRKYIKTRVETFVDK